MTMTALPSSPSSEDRTDSSRGGNRGHRLTTHNHIILRMEHTHLVRILNPGRGGVVKTIKSNYYKQGEVNFLRPRFPSQSAPAILIEYDGQDALIHPNNPNDPTPHTHQP